MRAHISDLQSVTFPLWIIAVCVVISALTNVYQIIRAESAAFDAQQQIDKSYKQLNDQLRKIK